MMPAEADLIGLLHRADWTALTMSAEANDGSTVLIAPGRRYRFETGDCLTGCDGDRPWEVFTEDPGDEEDDEIDVAGAHWISGPEPPLDELLCPAWLLTSSRLEVRGQATVCGRAALDVVMTRRPSIRRRIWPAGRWVDPVRVMVDAELGIVLRIEGAPVGEAPPQVLALVSLDLNPVIDPARFAPPPGSLIGESLGEALGAFGPVWSAMKTAAGLAAGGLGAWIRYSQSGRGRPAAGAEVPELAIPEDEPAPELSQDGALAGAPVGDDVLRALHEGGASEFTATLHEWCDLAALVSQAPAGARRTGFGGLGLLIDAISERPATVHLVSALRVGEPDRYQIDHAHDPKRGPTTIACDGEHRWQVYADKVTVGPAGPPPSDVGDLADPSWLLECRLSGGELVTVANRPAYRINVARGSASWSLSLMLGTAVAVVDAEMGIIVRLTSYVGGRPVRRYELADVISGGPQFRVDIPPDLPTVEESGPFDDPRGFGARQPANIPLEVASLVARRAAANATRAAKNVLRRLDGR